MFYIYKTTFHNTRVCCGMDRVEFKDTDGDTVAFVLDDAGVHYYVNGTLKVSKLKHLFVDNEHRIHLNGTSAGRWSAARTTKPADRAVCGKVLRLGRGGAQAEPVAEGQVEYSFKDTDGDQVSRRPAF